MTILDTIVEQKRREVALLPAGAVDGPTLKLAMEKRGDRRDFLGALTHPRRGRASLIAEVKKASPSAGVICPTSNRSASPKPTKPRAPPPCRCSPMSGFSMGPSTTCARFAGPSVSRCCGRLPDRRAANSRGHRMGGGRDPPDRGDPHG